MQKRLLIASAVVVALLLIAGCAQITTETTVSSDGDIEERSVEVTIEDQVYNYLLSNVRDDGHDDVEDWLRSNIEPSESSYGEITSDHTENENGSHTISASITDIPNEDLANVSITVDEEAGQLTYEHPNPFNLEEQANESNGTEDYMPSLEFTYIVNMPGEITDSNAHEVDEETNTAKWEYLGDDEPEDIYIESEQGNASSESIPGFTVTTGLLAFLTLSAIAVHRGHSGLK